MHLRIRILLAALLVVLAAMAAAEPAYGNSAPPRQYGDTGGAILPGASSEVHVLRESLRFELEERLGAATVTARYEMVNRGEPLTAFPVLFAIQDLGGDVAESFSVTWNGRPVPAAGLTIEELPEKQQAATRDAWTLSEQVLDPVTGDRYAFQGAYGRSELRFIRFALDLPSGEPGVLEVRYHHRASRDRRRHLRVIYHYQYLLLPARAWASFGPVEIAVAAPPPEQAFFAATLPMTWGDGAYRTTLPGLPEENLTFAVMSRAGLIGRWTTAGPYYVVAFLISAAASLTAAGLIGWLWGRLRSRWAAGALALLTAAVPGAALTGLIVSGVLRAIPALRHDHWGHLLKGGASGLALWLMGMALAWAVALRTHDRRQARQRAGPRP